MSTRLEPGFYPFWFWNSRLTTEEIRYQVKAMAMQGIKGFYIHPRQGLQHPYLADAYFHLFDQALGVAKEYGLSVHIYDEYPYPSGIAGGMVTLGTPKYKAVTLEQFTHDIQGGEVLIELPPGKVLTVQAFPLDACGHIADWHQPIVLTSSVGTILQENSFVETGLTAYNRKRYFASKPVPVLETVVPRRPLRIVAYVQKEIDHFKYWGSFVDVLNPEAVEYFLRLTHERYRERYSDEFGRAILSVFTDETAPGWSDALPKLFREEYRYELTPLLPALFNKEHPQHERVSIDFFRLKYALFIEAFEKKINAWCSAHNLLYAGEKPALRLAQLQYMDIPGCEPGHTKAGAPLDLLQAEIRSNAKATASAAYFYGKRGSLCECYHSIGWSGTLQDAKLIAEGLLLLGIDYIVPHGFFYSTHGLRKHDAPPSFFFQMPYWRFFGSLTRRMEHLAQLFQETYIDADVLVVEPHGGLPGQEDLAVYTALLGRLMDEHVGYHIVDTDILQRGEITDGHLHVKDITARTILVPPMPFIEQELAQWLDAFQTAGGEVQYLKTGMTGQVLAERVKQLPKSLSITVGGKEAAGLWVSKRVGKGRTYWFVLNTTPHKLVVDIDHTSLTEIPLGEPSDFQPLDDRYRRTIEAFESFVLAEDCPGEQPLSEPRLQRIKVAVQEEAKVKPLTKNLFRLDRWQMTLGDQTRPVSTAPLANQLAAGGFAFAPSVKQYFGVGPELGFPPMDVSYAISWWHNFLGPVKLVMEPDSLNGDWRMRINDSFWVEPAALKPTESHVRGSMAVDITATLRKGNNSIVIYLTTDQGDGGLVNPLYLAGDFGVVLGEGQVALVERPLMGRWQDYLGNLLPFFSGTLEYETCFQLESLPPTEQVIVDLEFPRPFYEACQVSFNGNAFQELLWSPRQLIVPTEHLTPGRNALTARVYTSLIRSFEGQWFDYRQHKYRSVYES